MTDIDSVPPPRPTTSLATKIGFALWGISLLWWFLYYANWHGAFGLMRLKVMCITSATSECEFFQQQIAGISGMPTYYPIFWWAGCIAMVVRILQTRAHKKQVGQ